MASAAPCPTRARLPAMVRSLHRTGISHLVVGVVPTTSTERDSGAATFVCLLLLSPSPCGGPSAPYGTPRCWQLKQRIVDEGQTPATQRTKPKNKIDPLIYVYIPVYISQRDFPNFDLFNNEIPEGTCSLVSAVMKEERQCLRWWPVGGGGGYCRGCCPLVKNAATVVASKSCATFCPGS
jgi:hypothetical protein